MKRCRAIILQLIIFGSVMLTLGGFSPVLASGGASWQYGAYTTDGTIAPSTGNLGIRTTITVQTATTASDPNVGTSADIMFTSEFIGSVWVQVGYGIPSYSRSVVNGVCNTGLGDNQAHPYYEVSDIINGTFRSRGAVFQFSLSLIVNSTHTFAIQWSYATTWSLTMDGSQITGLSGPSCNVGTGSADLATSSSLPLQTCPAGIPSSSCYNPYLASEVAWDNPPSEPSIPTQAVVFTTAIQAYTGTSWVSPVNGNVLKFGTPNWNIAGPYQVSALQNNQFRVFSPSDTRLAQGIQLWPFFSLTAASYQLSILPSYDSGGSTSTTLTAVSPANPSTSISFSASGQPSFVSVSFSPAQVIPTSSGATSMVSFTIPAGYIFRSTNTYNILIAGSSSSSSQSLTIALTVQKNCFCVPA